MLSLSLRAWTVPASMDERLEHKARKRVESSDAPACSDNHACMRVRVRALVRARACVCVSEHHNYLEHRCQVLI